MKNKEIGKRIREARTAKGIKQKKFAEQLGLHSASLSKIESGEVYTSVEILLKINSFLGVNLHWILTGEGTPETPAGGIEDKDILLMLKKFQKFPSLKHLVMIEFYKHLEQLEQKSNPGINEGKG